MAILNSGLAKSLAAGDYTIDNSLRFNDDGYLDRTPSASNRKTWTWSGWIKRGNLGAVGSRQHFFTHALQVIFWRSPVTVGVLLRYGLLAGSNRTELSIV